MLIGEIIGQVERLNDRVKELRNTGDAGGGIFCLFVIQDIDDSAIPNAVVRIGKFVSLDAADLLAKAREKAERLFSRKEHRTSWQSRNPAEHQWGGAIRVKDEEAEIILSFSGLPEEWDEALMLAAAYCCNLIEFDAVMQMAQPAAKPCFGRLVNDQ